MDEGMKILFVDDERNVLKSVRRLFLDDDYEILLANSGEEGIEILEEESPVPLVISDYKMPGMDGVEFLKRVRKKWPETVRIIFSGYADVAAVVAAVNEGQIYKFIPKPWKDDEFKVIVSGAIDYYEVYKKNVHLNKELERKNKELQELNNNLEDLVARRTEELEFQNKVLARSQNILDSLPVGVLGIDTEGMIVQCNRKGLEYLNRDGINVICMDRYDIFSDELNGFIDQVIESGYLSRKINLEDRNVYFKGILMDHCSGQKGIILIIDDREEDI